jgi:hypothetical protein
MTMSNVVKVIEVLAESDTSWEDAAARAIERASQTVHQIDLYREHGGEGREQPDRAIPHQRQDLVSPGVSLFQAWLDACHGLTERGRMRPLTR